MPGADVAVPFATGGMREVQMRGGGSAGVAGEGDLVACRDDLADFNLLNGEVTVAVAVIVYHITENDCPASGFMIIYLCDYCSYR